jgi:hypothetical protein
LEQFFFLAAYIGHWIALFNHGVPIMSPPTPWNLIVLLELIGTSMKENRVRISMFFAHTSAWELIDEL